MYLKEEKKSMFLKYQKNGSILLAPLMTTRTRDAFKLTYFVTASQKSNNLNGPDIFFWYEVNGLL